METDAQNSAVSKWTSSFAISFAVASVLNACLVVAKEKSPAVQSALQHLMGHHWISHSAIVICIFLALGVGLAQTNGGRGPAMTTNRLIGVVAGGLAVGAIIIVGFYLTEL